MSKKTLYLPSHTVNDDTHKKFLAAYDEFSDAVFRHCYFRTGSRDVAKDMTQQTFFNAWSYLQKGKMVDSFRPFLYRIAHNLLIDWYRRHRTESVEELTEQGFMIADPRSSGEKALEWNQVIHNIKRLDPPDQNLIVWRYVEDLPIDEIARMLKIKENAASVRLHRALERLRKFL